MSPDPGRAVIQSRPWSQCAASVVGSGAGAAHIAAGPGRTQCPPAPTHPPSGHLQHIQPWSGVASGAGLLGPPPGLLPEGVSRLCGPEMPPQLDPPSCSWHEHEPRLQAEEDLGQSEDRQVFHPGGELDCWAAGWPWPTLGRSSPNASVSPSSTRWTQQGIFATTGQPCEGQPIAP